MPVSGPRSKALWGVRGGIKKGSPARRVRVGLILDPHLHRPGEDVAHLLPRMLVPPRLDARRDLREHLNDLPSGNRRGLVLELGSPQLSGELVWSTPLGSSCRHRSTDRLQDLVGHRLRLGDHDHVRSLDLDDVGAGAFGHRSDHVGARGLVAGCDDGP